MWAAAGTIQRRDNVWLVQNPLPCLPCQNEGCDRHVLSFSKCLDELAPAQVLRAVDAALAAAWTPNGTPSGTRSRTPAQPVDLDGRAR
jgi:heptosyltransferase-3